MLFRISIDRSNLTLTQGNYSLDFKMLLALNIYDFKNNDWLVNFLPDIDSNLFDISCGLIEPYSAPCGFLNEQMIYIINLDHLIYNSQDDIIEKFSGLSESV